MFLGRGNFVELVERQRPLITVYSDEDVKTIEIGRLTFDEEDTLNSVIFRGLGRGLDPNPAMKPTCTPFRQIPIKKESSGTLEVDVIAEKPCTVDHILTHKSQHEEIDFQTRIAKRELVVKLKKLATDEKENVIMTEELKQNVLSASGYDSDETIIYNPGGVIIPKSPTVTKHDTKPRACHARKTRRRSSKSGFHISVHGIRQKRKRTYLGCKIPGCSLKFPSVQEWNSHHRLAHQGIQLTCIECKKSFKMPSFLRDRRYVHSKTVYKCEKCDKNFPFKSLYRIHVRTHLRSKIHKCFAGSCNKEYKWPQDLHRHIQTHLKLTYSCNICDNSNAKKYLLKRHLKRHNDKTNYQCDVCGFKCKWYTQLRHHSKKCTRSELK